MTVEPAALISSRWSIELGPVGLTDPALSVAVDADPDDILTALRPPGSRIVILGYDTYQALLTAAAAGHP